MLMKGSRYQKTGVFAPAEDSSTVFAGLLPREIGPADGVIEYQVKASDRLDLLALHFYNDSTLWWRILDANPELVDGADLSLKAYVGTVIVIPRAVESGAS